MKYIPSVLQVTGCLIIIAGVATINPLIAVTLSGAFLILFGIALEKRGK